MSTQVQYRRGSEAQNNAFTGALGEITVDTTNDTLRVHDGSTAGGFALVGANATQTLANKTLNQAIIVNGLLNGNANGVGNIGNSTGYFNTIFAKATSAQYADIAERYIADQIYEPGTILEIGGEQEVTQTTSLASTRIAGVVSTAPAVIMNAIEDSPTAVTVALLGRVPCRVTGRINRGDVLCSSGTSGHACALPANLYQPGVVIGKALEDHDSNGLGTIEVLVGRL
jgi:hypothetical protein